MKPSIGRIVHFHVPDYGWRPMMITKVTPPCPAITTGEENPGYISGWAWLDPSDDPDIRKVEVMLAPYRYAVIRAYEGTEERQWRWPPRV